VPARRRGLWDVGVAFGASVLPEEHRKDLTEWIAANTGRLWQLDWPKKSG